MQTPTSPELPLPVTLPERSTKQNVARATLSISVLHVLRLLIGFATQPLIANRLGLRWQADVYAVASDIVSSLWLIFEKIVNPTVLPIFGRSLKEDEKSAWQFASAAILLTCLGVALLTPLAWWGMPWIVDIYSQKAGPEQRELTVAISRLLLSGLFFLALSSLTYVLLNGYKRFSAAALGDAGWKMGVMVAAVYAMRVDAPILDSLYLLSYGFILGAFLKLLPQVWALRQKWGLFTARVDWSDPRLKQMLWLAVPLLLGVVTSEGRDIYRNWLADSPLIVTASGENIEGSRAALRFSRLISSSLVAVFPYALSIGIFPYLSDLATSRDRQPFTDTLVGALRACLFVFGPLTAILIALRLPLLSAVWQSGRFTAQDTLVLTAPFVAYSLGLMGMACENILNQSFYAMTRAWIPTLIGLGTTALFIVVATLGVHWSWGLAAIAGAESLSKTIKCAVMWWMLRGHLGEVKKSENTLFLVKVALGSLVAALVAALVIGWIAPDANAARFKLKMLLAVTVAGMGGVGVFLGIASLLKIEETRAFGKIWGRITKQFAR